MMREMKDSGVEWIGGIPVDWEIAQVKYLFRIGRGRVIAQTELDDNALYPVYSSQTKNNGCLGYIGSFDFDTDQLTWTTDGANAGTIFLREGKHNCTNVCGTLQLLTTSQNLLYQKYALEHIAFYHKRADTNGYKIMNNEMAAIFTIIPPINTQHRIADYLDNKCAKIDAIITREQAVIEKLKAYKLSVITEAVTKGLNPDVPMKDSGIDLCNKIPEQWTVSRIKYLFQLRDEKNYLPLEEVRLLSLYAEFGVFPHGEQDERGNKAVTADGYKAVYEKDIVVNIILAWMGAIGVSSYDGVTSPAYDIYKPFSNVNSKFYHHLFRTKAFSSECYKYGRGIMAMRWRTYSTEFKSIFVPVPPVEEQQQIVDYLDIKCAKINSAIDKKQAVIDKLTEYKKSLIYEVVTGKKEV